MAAGDITRTAGFPRHVGNMFMQVGTIEVDNTERVFAITDTKSRLVDVTLSDTDGVGTPWKRINENVAGTATNGSMTVAGNHKSVDTYNYVAYYV